MAGIEESTSANRSFPRRRITVRSATSHNNHTCPRPGILRIQFQIWKSYFTDEPLGFSRRTFSAALWFPLSVLADPSETLPDFMNMFNSAKLADEDDLWGEIMDLVLTPAIVLHVPNTRQLIGVAVRIEVPADETDIHELRQFKVSDEGSLVIDECSICFEELSSGEELTETVRCLHVFHSSCLRRWLKAKDSCPLCRRVLIS